MGTEPPDPSFVDEHLRAALPHGRVVTERGVEAGWGLSACVTGHAMFGRFAGGDARLKEEALGEMVGRAVVPVWVVQGREDSVVSLLRRLFLFLVLGREMGGKEGGRECVLICRATGPGAVFDGFRGGGEAVLSGDAGALFVGAGRACF